MSNDLFEKCMELTPVEGGVFGTFYKRDDLFKPFQDSPVNGTKLRQCIWLIGKQGSNSKRVVSAASVLSPQLAMVARVSKEFNKKCLLVIGSKLDVARKNPMVALAESYGAEFEYSACPYNKALQRQAQKFIEPSDFFLEYGISTSNPNLWMNFYSFAGQQTRNIPSTVKTITMTAGSCNSALGVFTGLHSRLVLDKYKFNLVGVGPSKMNLLKERFKYISGVDLPMEQITYYPLHEDKIYSYSDRQKFQKDGIDFHPTYEGKMMAWLSKHKPEILQDNKNLVWVVGSEPRC